jgi:hypothetical protein
MDADGFQFQQSVVRGNPFGRVPTVAPLPGGGIVFFQKALPQPSLCLRLLIVFNILNKKI